MAANAPECGLSTARLVDGQHGSGQREGSPAAQTLSLSRTCPRPRSDADDGVPGGRNIRASARLGMRADDITDWVRTISLVVPPPITSSQSLRSHTRTSLPASIYYMWGLFMVSHQSVVRSWVVEPPRSCAIRCFGTPLAADALSSSLTTMVSCAGTLGSCCQATGAGSVAGGDHAAV